MEGTVGTSKIGSSVKAAALPTIAWQCIQSCGNNNLFYQVGLQGSESSPRCKGNVGQDCFTYPTLSSCQSALGLDPQNGALRGIVCPANNVPAWCVEAKKQLIAKGVQTTCGTAVGISYTYCAFEYVL